MPTELELIALKTEFDLYLGFVKRLVLDLPDSDDRTRAALWLLKLRSIHDDDHMKLRNEHLKLFLFALHRRSLVGIFEKKPPKGELESFHDGLTVLEMTRELIEITEKKKTEAKKEGEEGYGMCPLPPVRSNFSYDLKEYAASQEIPKFGAHCYYAVSSEPIQLWHKSAENAYPDKGAIPNQLEWEQAMSKLSDHILQREAEIDAALAAEKEKEIGFVFDDAPEETDVKPELEVQVCQGARGGGAASAARKFRWDVNSHLNIYQNYDFSDVGDAEDLEGQGKHQLELDEDALSFMEYSLPGRRKALVRSPYFEGLPEDIAERRHHGVVETIPDDDDDDDCDGYPCDAPCEEAAGTGYDLNDTHDDDCKVCASGQNSSDQLNQLQSADSFDYSTGGYASNLQIQSNDRPSTAQQYSQIQSGGRLSAGQEFSQSQRNGRLSAGEQCPQSETNDRLSAGQQYSQSQTNGRLSAGQQYSKCQTNGRLSAGQQYSQSQRNGRLPAGEQDPQSETNSRLSAGQQYSQSQTNGRISAAQQNYNRGSIGAENYCQPCICNRMNAAQEGQQSKVSWSQVNHPIGSAECPPENDVAQMNQWQSQNQNQYQQSFTGENQPQMYNQTYNSIPSMQPDVTRNSFGNQNTSNMKNGISRPSTNGGQKHCCHNSDRKRKGSQQNNGKMPQQGC